MTKIINSLSDIAPQYDAVFCDLWGCLHDGIRPFQQAVDALSAYKASGGIVILLTNAPRPRAQIAQHLANMGVPADIYDDIASSGDSARFGLINGAVDNKVYHIGNLENDNPFFEPGETELFAALSKIERVDLKNAEGIVCTNLFDDINETPEDYTAILLSAKNQGLPFLCANPDIMVDVGDQRRYCPGALAQIYADMGGEVLYFGKPHPGIYDLARTKLTRVAGKEIADDRILCIGDGIATDVRGASGEALDVLFVTGGLAQTETGTADQPNADLLRAYLDAHQLSAQYAIGKLR